MRIVILYLLSIVGINAIFAHTGPEFGAFLIGIVFVLRDYVQREIGHTVLLVMITACVISYFMASPIVATASLTAFVFAEIADWAVYSSLQFKFQYRVLLSSVLGVAVDSMVFLPMIGVPLYPLVLVQWCSKMTAAGVVWGWYQVKA